MQEEAEKNKNTPEIDEYTPKMKFLKTTIANQ